MKKGPDELATDVFEAEFECSVLKDGVVTAVEGGGSNVKALLVGDFFGSNEMVGIAGAGGGDGGVKWMSEGISESDAGGGGLYLCAGGDAFEHARLSGHVGGSFYTEVES